MPSTHSTSVSRLFPSSTVITPSFPTFSIASAKQLADFAVVVRRRSSRRWPCLPCSLTLIDIDLQLVGDVADRLFDALLHVDRIDTRNDGLQAFVENRFGHHGRGRGAVAGDIAGLAGDFANHASAHVFVHVFQVDLFGDRNAVLGDGWRAKALLKNHVAALWAERHFDGTGQLANAAANCFASFLIECNNLCHCLVLS